MDLVDVLIDQMYQSCIAGYKVGVIIIEKKELNVLIPSAALEKMPPYKLYVCDSRGKREDWEAFVKEFPQAKKLVVSGRLILKGFAALEENNVVLVPTAMTLYA